jgi:hypothetical protein
MVILSHFKLKRVHKCGGFGKAASKQWGVMVLGVMIWGVMVWGIMAVWHHGMGHHGSRPSWL